MEKDKIFLEENSEYLKKSHELMLEILIFIDKLCRDNNINYSLDTGTLIGAVRHGGFIPWDDDADISFTRENYEKFIQILNNTELPDNIKIYNPILNNHFYDFSFRLYNTKEKIRNEIDNVNKFNGFTQYAIVDIFVYDEVPIKKMSFRLYILKLQLIFGLSLSKRYNIIYKHYKGIYKLFAFVLSIFGKLFSIKFLYEKYRKASMSYFKKNTGKCYCTSWSPEYPGWIYNSKDLEEYIDIEFENKKLMIFKNYDNILTIGYGDYMTPILTHDHIDYVNNF